MSAIGQLLAAQVQPGIQRIPIVKGKPWAEQLAAEKLDLVLHLTTRHCLSDQWRSNGSFPS